MPFELLNTRLILWNRIFCSTVYRERADLQHTVQVMADLGLTYVQTKNADGTYQYQVEPDISYLFNFKGTLFLNLCKTCILQV